VSAWAIVRRIVVILGPPLYSAVTRSIIESKGMISFCQFGAGRIGAIHAANIAAHPEARLNTIIETDRAAAERLAGRYGAVLRGQAEALADPAIDAVLIASSTDTHADLVEAAARAGKAIFCEKPLDLDRRRAAACWSSAGHRRSRR
jgi:myo-inositol 2-dehydrogenase / D-chiro-inositol 1-dehydrogenase